jgi:hypothetical protein
LGQTPSKDIPMRHPHLIMQTHNAAELSIAIQVLEKLGE